MRAAAAAFPEPCSATTSTGTSFWDNSRSTASTVRMPGLMLSSQTFTPPFIAGRALCTILLPWISMIRHSDTEAEGRWSDKGVHNLLHNHCHLRQNVRFRKKPHKPRFQWLAIARGLATRLLNYHSADKWENFCPHRR